MTSEHWNACEAVRLFVERARLSVPKFSLADDTAVMPWPRSADDWTAFRWPSNWPQPA